MNQKPKLHMFKHATFTLVVVATSIVALVIAIITAIVIWLIIGSSLKTRHLGQALDKLNINQSYSQVHNECRNEEGLSVCQRGYLPAASLDSVRLAMIQRLKTAGYVVYDMPHGYDGQNSSFFARNADTAIVVEMVNTSNAAYIRKYGTLQVIAYVNSDVPNRFDLGAQL